MPRELLARNLVGGQLGRQGFEDLLDECELGMGVVSRRVGEGSPARV
ncbi:hypothetical protein [Streptomyces sp. NPDC050600]